MRDVYVRHRPRCRYASPRYKHLKGTAREIGFRLWLPDLCKSCRSGIQTSRSRLSSSTARSRNGEWGHFQATSSAGTSPFGWGMRRFTRLTNAFSKKIQNREASVALHFMYYNFARVHQTLRITPAMAAGISNHVWSFGEIVAMADKNCKRLAA